MKNKLITKIACTLFVLGATFTLGACNDWTEIEGVKVPNPNIEQQNPELYAQYLAALRSYKQSSHQVTYAWFDNHVKVPFTRAQHLTELPDSLDVVALMYPDQLVDRELDEIKTIREQKGTKVIFTINYEAIKLKYDQAVAEQAALEQAPKPAEFTTVLMDTMQLMFDLVARYNYDGISIGYKGKSLIHLTPEERAEEITNQNGFMKMIADWHQRQPGKMLVFEGKPQNLINKEILADCKLIILPSADVSNEDLLTYQVKMAQVDGVPTDRFAVAVSTTSLDPSDTKTGYFSNGTRALSGATNWTIAAHDFPVAGLGIYNVSNDYFNTAMSYQYTRGAISALNPPIKK